MRATTFSDSRNCLHKLMSRNLAERRVLLVGSSRMRHALDPGVIATSLGLPPTAVLNLGHPERDMMMDAALVADLADRTQLSLVVVELDGASGQVRRTVAGVTPVRARRPPPVVLDGLAYQETTILVARYRFLFDRLTGSPLMRAHSAVVLAFRKIELTMKVIGGRAVLSTLLSVDQAIDRKQTNVCYIHVIYNPAEASRQLHTKERLRQAFEMAGLTDRDKTDFLTAPDRATDRRAVEILTDISERKAFRLVFLYLPTAHAPLPDAEFARAFQAKYGAPLVVPDAALMRRLGRDGYHDDSHLTHHGRALFSARVGREIAAAASAP